MADILLIEDDAAIREGLEISFAQAGHKLLLAASIKEAEAFVSSESFALVLLDVALPDGNGFDFYKEVLSKRNKPVIFLTARDDENDVVRGLEYGAEDYITKPFSIRELMARINKVLGRQNTNRVVCVEDISVDLGKMEVRKAGGLLNLSSLEIKIVKLLFENVNKVVDRNAVIDLIWEATGNDVYDHTVTVYIKRIREKMGVDVIKTVKGVGYRVDASCSQNGEKE